MVKETTITVWRNVLRNLKVNSSIELDINKRPSITNSICYLQNNEGFKFTTKKIDANTLNVTRVK